VRLEDARAPAPGQFSSHAFPAPAFAMLRCAEKNADEKIPAAEKPICAGRPEKKYRAPSRAVVILRVWRVYAVRSTLTTAYDASKVIA
jgi:hypothetical protein